VLRVLFTVPGLGWNLHSFSLTLLLACFGAVAVTIWHARRAGIDVDSVWGLANWLLAGGIIGARVMFLAMHPEAVHHFGDVFKLWQGGIVFYGCILGGLIGSILYWVRHPFPFLAMADAVAPALAVGIALGRLGCFLNGCCYGAVTDSPLAVRFPVGAPAWVSHVEHGWIAPAEPRSLPVHPTQLYAAFDGLILLGLLTWYFPRRRRDGAVMALLMVVYPVLRFLNECLRADEPPVVAGLTIAQAISVALLVSGLLTWLHLARRNSGTTLFCRTDPCDTL
jgi:phosphatidylglycerol:prolipoprotein diacylglycerol transferase